MKSGQRDRRGWADIIEMNVARHPSTGSNVRVVEIQALETYSSDGSIKRISSVV